MGLKVIMFHFQVAAEVVFTLMEEVQNSSVVQRGMAGKGAKDFFRVEWVEEPGITMHSEGLEEVVVLMETVEVVEAGEATLEEAAETMNQIPVEEGEDLTMLEKISRMNVVTIQVDMVR